MIAVDAGDAATPAPPAVLPRSVRIDDQGDCDFVAVSQPTIFGRSVGGPKKWEPVAVPEAPNDARGDTGAVTTGVRRDGNIEVHRGSRWSNGPRLHLVCSLISAREINRGVVGEFYTRGPRRPLSR